MAVLTVRNLPEDAKERLRLRAARAGNSMEAEARAILVRASLEDPRRASAHSLQQWVTSLYGDRKPSGVVEALLDERRREVESNDREP